MTGTWPLFFVAWFWIIGVCLLADVPYGWGAIPLFIGAFILRSVKREEWRSITYLALVGSFLFFFAKIMTR